MEKIKTGCISVDDMLLGGVSVGKPIGIYGLYDCGKTWLVTQTGFSSTRPKKDGGLGKDTLYLDTEAFYDDETFATFFTYFQRRWGLQEANADMFHIKNIQDVYHLGRFFGMEFQIIQEEKRTVAVVKYPKKRSATRNLTSKATKSTTQDEAWILRSPIYELLSKGNYGLVILDSITVPVKSVIPVATQNLSARASILQPLLSAIKFLSREFDVGFMVTNHGVGAKGSGAMFFGSAKPWAESVMLYYVKRWMGILMPLSEMRKQYGERARRVLRYRYPGQDRHMGIVKLEKNVGYIDF
jgi:RecA/RadA recombinase